VIGTIWRSLQLTALVVQEKPDLSLSHGSRSLIILSSFLRIPTVLLFDYEHSMTVPFLKPVIGIAPEAIRDDGLAKHFRHGLRRYQGFKEDVYVSSFIPDPTALKMLALRETDIIATLRPPATEAHYHNPESDRLFVEVVDFLGSTSNVRMVILPRNEKTQREYICRTWPQWCQDGKIILPEQPLNGLDLIWHSDLVVSGGGTMNREAAALGVPVYSIFRGRLGAVDRYLAAEGRLTLVESSEEIRLKIRPVRRNNRHSVEFTHRPALRNIMAAIDEVIARM
jgi:predicted glycosyltransferase